jgi:DnaJ-class molecular chaperone
MEEDYYKILGVSRNASAAEIQKAYRALAKKYHPDVNPEDRSAKTKFQRVQKAYDVLKDPQKREMYDRYGSSFESMGAGGPGGGAWRTTAGGPAGFEEFDFSQLFGGRHGDEASGFEGSFGDIFRQFTGAGGAGRRQTRRRSVRGRDLRHELEIPFQTAVTGGEARLNVQRPTGKVDSITVKIPAGIDDGKTIRLRGQGEPGSSGGPDGDILITVRVAPHPCFRRRGKDLEVAVPVSLAEAAQGANVDVPTPKGVISLRVPAGTSSGRRLRVKGHGVASADGTKGDLYAEIQIALPKDLDDESLALIRQIDERNSFDPRRGLRW